MTFAKGDKVIVKHWGEAAEVVATPDEVEAVEGLKGHYRIRLDDASKGFRFVAESKLMPVPAPDPAFFHIPPKPVQKYQLCAWGGPVRERQRVFLGVGNDFNVGGMWLTVEETETLIEALQHSLAELALVEAVQE